MKECAKKWDMDSCKWMFAEDKEIEADVSLMVDLRGELAQDIQSLNKIVAASRCSTMFAQKVEEIKEPMTAAKARGGRYNFAPTQSSLEFRIWKVSLNNRLGLS